MASLSAPPPNLNNCTPYAAADPVLGHIIVFYSSLSSSSSAPSSPSASQGRIEAHIFSCAGFQSYPKFALSQTSPLYAAVNHLPLQKQTSELHRGLAIAVLKYFSELSKAVKETLLRSQGNGAAPGEAQAVAFDEMHAGDLAARLKEVETESLATDLMCALAERFAGAVDLDIVVRSPENSHELDPNSVPEDVGKILSSFGEPTYLPFSKLKRAASRPASTIIRPKSLKDTAEALERELEELRHTEENYVAKLRELLEDIAKPLKQRRPSSRKGEGSALSPKELDTLFPPCLEIIIEVNARFLEGIRSGGIEDVSKCCLESFPSFKKPYEEYMQASAEFPQLLAKLTKQKDSSVSKRIQQTGEQKLRSLIIEPVQRLPRYSLLIDNMLSLLPSDHPSLGPLNDARGIITEICSLQSSETTERTTTVKRLQSFIASWPLHLQPTGRLITAIDYLDIMPPYNGNTSEASSSLLLLFPDCVVFLRRPSSKSVLARGVMAEVDRPGGGVATNAGSGTRRDGGGHDLQFTGWIDIADVKLAGSDVGTVLWMTLASNLKDGWDIRAGGTSVRKMRLLNQYEGRAHKVEEEFAKARLERRMGRKTKGVIGLREAKCDGLTLWSCVWGSLAGYSQVKQKGSTVVYLDIGTTGSTASRAQLLGDVGKDGVDIVFSLEKTKQLRLECRSWNEYSSTDTVSYEELLPAFTMRLSSLLRLHSSPQHPPLTSALLSANRKLLRSLGVPFEGEGRFSKLRPPSPVKLINSILNTPGSPNKQRVGLMERTQSQMLPPKEQRPVSMFQRGTTIIGLVGDDESRDREIRHRITMAIESPLRKLEDTFEALVNSMRMIGSSGVDLGPLYEIHKVDHDEVDFLLAQLVADPQSCRLGKDIGIDVVFVAFAKFLSSHWKDEMGPVISEAALAELRDKSGTLYPGDFEDFFRIFVLDWTPQNKRAFRTIIVLLKEMQEKVEAEDDKGMLTKAFTELLVGEEVNALDYMGLVDMLVGDMDTLFSGQYLAFMHIIFVKYLTEYFTEAPPPQLENGAVKRAKSVNVVPNPSSFRKRLGLSHSSSVREGSRLDMSRPHSVWRTLSKKDNKTRMERAKSIDYGRTGVIPPPLRPMSRDRPVVLGSGGGLNGMGGPNGPITPTQTTPRPMSTILASPIHLVPPGTPAENPRHKRRSSLGDLTNHPDYRQLHPAPTLTPPIKSNSELNLDVYPDGPKPLPPPPPLEPHGSISSPRELPRLGSSHSSRSDENSPPSTLSRRQTARKSFGAAAAVPVPLRLKMQSTQKVYTAAKHIEHL